MFFAAGTVLTSDPQVMLEGMSLGLTPTQADVFTTTTGFCESRVSPDSIYGLLHRECFRLFGDEMFADLFADSGRNCVPPMIVAVVMVLQRFEGCSDREAVDRFTFDARWKYAAGGLGFDYPGFAHTVLVDMRARLRARSVRTGSSRRRWRPRRQAGLVGRQRVLDSTALYDAVATMDTVTLIRSAIRGLLAACDRVLEAQLRGLLSRDDDYASAGKPVCDYEDRQAREELIDALAKDAPALLGALDGRELGPELEQAAALLAAVVGQDLDEGEDGVFRIARRVAKDRVISTVDPEARHGHKTSAPRTGSRQGRSLASHGRRADPREPGRPAMRHSRPRRHRVPGGSPRLKSRAKPSTEIGDGNNRTRPICRALRRGNKHRESSAVAAW